MASGAGDDMNSADANRKPFCEIEHTADLALRVYGRDLPEFLRHAAQGMYHLMGVRLDAGGAGPGAVQQVDLAAGDAEELLVDWLGELAYWVESQGLVFGAFQFHTVSPRRLRATLQEGRKTPVEKTIKAVTYHDLRIETTPHGLEATVVFDV